MQQFLIALAVRFRTKYILYEYSKYCSLYNQATYVYTASMCYSMHAARVVLYTSCAVFEIGGGIVKVTQRAMQHVCIHPLYCTNVTDSIFHLLQHMI